MNALIVAAHPDDEVLGCGGTMARLVREGWNVFVHILGQGAMARDEGSESAVQGLRAATSKAMHELGVSYFRHHDFPDNKMDTIPMLDVVKVVEGAIAEIKPDVIYTHHTGDLNVDHRITAIAVLTATRPEPDHSVLDVYSWEVPSSTEWAFFSVGQPFEPNVFVDIGSDLPAKLDAMKAYHSELRESPHPRSLESIEALAITRGSAVGVSAAEAFYLVRSIRKSSAPDA